MERKTKEGSGVAGVQKLGSGGARTLFSRKHAKVEPGETEIEKIAKTEISNRS
jgi:hypothetical protein